MIITRVIVVTKNGINPEARGSVGQIMKPTQRPPNVPRPEASASHSQIEGRRVIGRVAQSVADANATSNGISMVGRIKAGHHDSAEPNPANNMRSKRLRIKSVYRFRDLLALGYQHNLIGQQVRRKRRQDVQRPV